MYHMIHVYYIMLWASTKCFVDGLSARTRGQTVRARQLGLLIVKIPLTPKPQPLHYMPLQKLKSAGDEKYAQAVKSPGFENAHCSQDLGCKSTGRPTSPMVPWILQLLLQKITQRNGMFSIDENSTSSRRRRWS